MVSGKIFLIFQQGIEEFRPLKRRVNGIIDHSRSACILPLLSSARSSHSCAHSAESQIIIPGKDIQLSVMLIQIIIVCHISGKTVHIHGKCVHCHIFQHIVHIQIVL